MMFRERRRGRGREGGQRVERGGLGVMIHLVLGNFNLKKL